MRSISPAALYLRLLLIALVGGPLLTLSLLPTKVESYGSVVLSLLAGCLLGSLLSSLSLPRLRPQRLAPLPEAAPVEGVAKLMALLVLGAPPSIRSLTGRALVALDPESGLPVLVDLEPPSHLRLLGEGSILLTIALIWSLAISWAALNLEAVSFAGLLLVLLGVGGALVALLQRIGWGVGGYLVQLPRTGVPVWAAPLIPTRGPNKFRGMSSPGGRRILVRPDVVEAPYLPYLVAHEQAHIALGHDRAIWIELGAFVLTFAGSGIALSRWGALGLLPLLLLIPHRLLMGRFSYQSELAVDERVWMEIGAEAWLDAMEVLVQEGTNAAPLPRWYRLSPTIAERIDHLQQRFDQN